MIEQPVDPPEPSVPEPAQRAGAAGSAFEHLPVAAMVLDAAGFCVTANRSFSDLFDVGHACSGRHYEELLPPALHAILAELIGGEGSSLPAGTKEVGAMRVTVRRMPHPEGALLVVVQRAEGREAAAPPSLVRDQLVAHLSHELRSPVSAILGFADLLSGRVDDPRDRHALSSIRRNTAHLLELVKNALDLTRIDREGFPLDFGPTAVDEVVAQVVSMMNARAEEKDVALEVAYAGRIPACIHCDALRLRQVLVNLVSNAVKFTDEGTVRIRIAYEDAQGRLRFEVTDTGVGIAPEKRDAIFNAFDQGNSNRARRLGGAGLGLAIVQALVTALGGTVEVESEVDAGSTFRFFIPVGNEYPLELVEARRSVGGPPGISVDAGTLSGFSIMVVDDSEDVRASVAEILTAAGAAAATAEDGRDALDRIQAGDAAAFDCVVMDIQMPVMDGIEATARLREGDFKGLIVALTAGASDEERARCLRVGCDAVLVKPLGAASLVEALGSLLAAADEPATFDQKTVKHGHGRLLLVDDHGDAAEALELLLESIGFEVEVAPSCREARRLFDAYQPTIIVADYFLPDGTGCDLLAELGAESGAACVRILISGQAVPGAGEAADAVLQKPISLAELTETISALQKAG